MLTEYDLFPEPMHTFWKMVKGIILYVGGNKPGLCPKGWRWQVVRVLHHKAGGSTDSANTFMLLIRMDEEWNPIELKTWASKTISCFPEDNFLGEYCAAG